MRDRLARLGVGYIGCWILDIGFWILDFMKPEEGSSLINFSSAAATCRGRCAPIRDDLAPGLQNKLSPRELRTNHPDPYRAGPRLRVAFSRSILPLHSAVQ
jgi:hypothetical protein